MEKKNILIITIGTRDVQTREEILNKLTASKIIQRGVIPATENRREKLWIQVSEQPDSRVEISSNDGFNGYFLFWPPRDGGQRLISPAYPAELFCFPLIEKAIEYLNQPETPINYVLLVYTDQEGQERVSPQNLQKDTLYFNDLMARYLRDHPATRNAKFDEYCVSQFVADIDFQYRHFDIVSQKEEDSLFMIPKETVQNIYLLAQGGIDQINTALTLRLIEHFPRKVSFIQQPDQRPVSIKDFPTLFVDNLIRGKAELPLSRYEFGTIEAIVDEPIAKLLAQLGVALQSLDISRVKSTFANLFAVGYENSKLLTDFQELSRQHEDLAKQKLLFLNALVELKSANYNDALWRLRTLGEVLQASRIEQRLGYSISDPKQRHQLIKAIKQYKTLAKELDRKTNYDENKWITNSAFVPITHNELYPNLSSPLKECLDHVDKIKDLRNQLIHSAKPVTEKDINSRTSLAQMEKDWRGYFKTPTGFGIFDTIRDEIKNLL